MSKYIAKHIEQNTEVASAAYDTKLDAIYGPNKSLNWAKSTAQFMKGFVVYEDDQGNEEVVYESNGFRKGQNRKKSAK